jgi:flagellar hook-basal body complex protein FliE
MRVAEMERQKVLTGETNNLHQATIAASEAGIAFSLMIEVRNKLVESYQEIIRMQV